MPSRGIAADLTSIHVPFVPAGGCIDRRGPHAAHGMPPENRQCLRLAVRGVNRGGRTQSQCECADAAGTTVQCSMNITCSIVLFAWGRCAEPAAAPLRMPCTRAACNGRRQLAATAARATLRPPLTLCRASPAASTSFRPSGWMSWHASLGPSMGEPAGVWLTARTLPARGRVWVRQQVLANCTASAHGPCPGKLPAYQHHECNPLAVGRT